MKNGSKHRVVVLTGNAVWHKNTCATLIDAGVNVTGICIANRDKAGLPIEHVRRSIRRHGLWRTASAVVGRIGYRLVNSGRDRRIRDALFDRAHLDEVLRRSGVPQLATDDYGSRDTLAWLRSRDADILVVHSGHWVPKAVRELPREGIVIGGHPGLTPRYRGSHSAFWAIYNDRPEDVGCSVFWLDAGVDTGDLIRQEPIPVESGDSYFSLGWKGMKRIAEIQAETIVAFDAGVPIPRKELGEIPAGSELPTPTLGEYLSYRWRQRKSAHGAARVVVR